MQKQGAPIPLQILYSCTLYISLTMFTSRKHEHGGIKMQVICVANVPIIQDRTVRTIMHDAHVPV